MRVRLPGDRKKRMKRNVPLTFRKDRPVRLFDREKPAARLVYMTAFSKERRPLPDIPDSATRSNGRCGRSAWHRQRTSSGTDPFRTRRIFGKGTRAAGPSESPCRRSTGVAPSGACRLLPDTPSPITATGIRRISGMPLSMSRAGQYRRASE